MRDLVSLWVVTVSACIGLPCGLAAQTGAADRGAEAVLTTEDQIFDANRQDPVVLLQQLYEEKKVVALSEPDHADDSSHLLLSALLDKIGHDPRLRYIALERLAWLAPAYEKLSVNDVAEADLKAKVASLVRSPYDSYDLDKVGIGVCSVYPITWGKILPQVRTINTRRPPGQQLLVTGIDGKMGQDGTAIQREIATSEHFEKIWKRLGPSDKALVIYHQGHLTKGFVGKYPEPLGELDPTWMGIFLRHHPEAEAQTAIVFLDHSRQLPAAVRLKPGAVLPKPGAMMLNMAERQSPRYPDQSWGVRLAPFKHIAVERGFEVFVPEADWVRHAQKGGYPRFRTTVSGSDKAAKTEIVSTATLPEMADAIVWQAKTPWFPAYLQRPASFYHLPIACKK